MGNETLITAPETAGRLRITDKVGEDFKKWNDGMRIVFDAGTNSGKTYFILNVLLPWAYEHHKTILCLCNRIPLRDQYRQDIESLGRVEETVRRWNRDLRKFVPEVQVRNKYERTIRVETYQWLETFFKGNRRGAAEYLKSFGYVVADEYHYELTDPTINENIDISYQVLNALTKRVPVIFMSATASTFFNHWKDTGEVEEANYYHIPPDYSYVSKVKFFWTDDEEVAVIRQEARRGKVLVFVDSIDHIRKLKEALQDEFPDDVATACSSYREEARDFDGLEAVIQGEKLCKRITIVTTVFYNGVNIKDPELKCIISRQWNPIVNAQILGRKRPLDAEDTCTVYFKEYGHDFIKAERERIRKYQLQPAQQWKEGKKDPSKWDEYVHKTGTVELLDSRCKTVHRDRYGSGWVWHRRAELQYLCQMDALKRMMNDGYERGLLKEISELLLDRIEALCFKELEDYIEEHLEEKMRSEVMRDAIVRMGHIDNPNNRHKNKKPSSLRTINLYLKRYHVMILSKQERINATERAMFWTLHRIDS